MKELAQKSVVGPFAPASLTESFKPTKALTPERH